MNIYGKLQQCRVDLQNQSLKKTGQNKFAGYEYFELCDFIPAINAMFKDIGLCGVVSYSSDVATLTIVNIEKPEETIIFTSPMSTAALKGCHEVQNLGAVETYLRRYLWTTALEITESDALDKTHGKGQEQAKNRVSPPKAENEPPPPQAGDTAIAQAAFESYAQTRDSSVSTTPPPAPVISEDTIESVRIKEIDQWLLEMAGGVEKDYLDLLARVSKFPGKENADGTKKPDGYARSIDKLRGRANWVNKVHHTTKDMYENWKGTDAANKQVKPGPDNLFQQELVAELKA